MLKILVFIVSVPLISWTYFRFIHFPVELERHAQGPYTVIALAEPTTFRGNRASWWFECTSVAFGSIHNYTQIRVELRKDGKLLDSAILASGEDLPGDHIPLRVHWSGGSVMVAEHKRGTAKRFSLGI